ncbi:hyaluronan mediated motility receptor isoform X1 [Callorhinchus milii]|uniref:Hyaluronan mediated motility receptor-like protein n=1 Tax=Callorhinchus milii TaxID=7868 RepID=V9KDT3_CALMI|nr:hyaluronan mediated motility receptor isoform X1 [Callorhinchus milii]
MSFPRAPLRRFNEQLGCAPPPGHYDVKQQVGSRGPVSFDKSNRFHKGKDVGSQPLPETEKNLTSPASARRNLGFSTPNCQVDVTLTLELKKRQMLEKEVRCLVQQRGEQDKRLHSLEEEMKRIESKLSAAVREKTSQASNMASMERQLADLHKANELLKTKFSDDGTKKKINSLCLELLEVKNKADAKDKELSYLQINLEGKVKILQADLEASRSSVTALQERNGSLEEMHQETKIHSEDLEREMDKFHAEVINELRENNQALQEYLDCANERIQHLQTELSLKVEKYESKLGQVSMDLEAKYQAAQAKRQEVEADLQEMQSNLNQSTKYVSELHGKLIEIEQERATFAEDKAEMEKRLLQCTEDLRNLTEQSDSFKEEMRQSEERQLQKENKMIDLREKEKLLCEQIKEVTEKYQQVQKEKGSLVAESNEKEQCLAQELELEKEKSSQVEQRCQALQQEQDELLISSRKDKEMVESLSQQLEIFQGAMAEEKELLQEKLGTMLDELEKLQAKEMEAEEVLKCLEQETKQKTRELDEVKAQLSSKSAEFEKVIESYNRTISKLREEHSSSLRKLGDIEIEFQSYKESVSEKMAVLQEESSRLQSDIAQLQRQLQDKQQQLTDSQASQEKAKEEYARMLLGAQTKLAHREAEVRKVEHVHNVTITQLQVELQESHTRYRELEAAERDSRKVAVDEDTRPQLLAEVQKWQILYEELHNKVKPFQEQLDAFERERSSLLNERGATQEELQKLSVAYTKLLGHQNQRQKIKHVMKLKVENGQLKQEVAKLRFQLSKDKQKGKRLQEQPVKVHSVKAFQSIAKENVAPLTPLREGNRNIR